MKKTTLAARMAKDVRRELRLDPVDVEGSRRRMLITIIFGIGLIFLFPFGSLCLFRGYRLLGMMVIGAVLVVIITYLQYRRFRNYRLTAGIYLFLLGLLFDYLVASGGINHTGPLWAFAFPLFSFSLFDLVLGGWSIAVYFLSLAVVLFVPDFPLLSETYTLDYKVRLLSSLFAVSVIAFFTEYVRSRTQAGLTDKNRQLGTAMTDLRKAQYHLKHQARELERSNRELTDFAHIASHDLQEPLRKVTVFGDRLAARAGDALDDRSKDYLARMQNAAARMTGLLDGLLEYARVTTKGNPFVTVNMDDVVAGVLDDLEVRISETGGRVRKGPLGTVRADALQLRQLIQNLVGNALKYHKPDVPPVVEIAGAVTDDKAWYELTVRDNGIGIADKDKEKAFGIFQRLVGKGTYEGSGVGLSICRKIAERHGGTIDLKGEISGGTVFTVRLPVRHGDSAEAA